MAKKKPTIGGAREGAGRKLNHPEGTTVPVTVRVPETLIAGIDAMAGQRDLSRSEMVTEAIRGFLNANERKAGESNPSVKDPTGKV